LDPRAVSARRELDEITEALSQAGRRATADEWRDICALHAAAERASGYSGGDGVSVWASGPPSLRALEIRFKPVEPEPEPEPEEADTGEQDNVTRSPDDIKGDERRRLMYAIRRHVDTGEPTLRKIQRDYGISWRQVRVLRDREVEFAHRRR
jgi:hypothetical protein